MKTRPPSSRWISPTRSRRDLTNSEEDRLDTRAVAITQERRWSTTNRNGEAMTEHPPSTLRLHARDDVVIAMEALSRGVVVDTSAGPVTPHSDIAPGHKMATRPRAIGDPVYKCG